MVGYYVLLNIFTWNTHKKLWWGDSPSHCPPPPKKSEGGRVLAIKVNQAVKRALVGAQKDPYQHARSLTLTARPLRPWPPWQPYQYDRRHGGQHVTVNPRDKTDKQINKNCFYLAVYQNNMEKSHGKTSNWRRTRIWLGKGPNKRRTQVII